MQFEVLAQRLDREFGAAVELTRTNHHLARRTDKPTAEALKATRGVRILRRRDGVLLAAFDSPFWLERVQSDHPEWVLDTIATG
jgi:peptide chain release factor 3